ncbi:type II toxin-antitoxin system VapC family toxin [Streptomyces sp. NPDC101213]|uniref:type II toxin-antitoxin system VapC family toxin n=1 Tax=Streptomyces sp. NPDC101213 TaxID=3366130 RepID=UPI0037F6D2FD
MYLDSNCFIDWAQGTGSAREAESMLRAAKAGHVRLHTSTLTFAEARGTNASDHRLRIRALLQEPYVILVEVTRRVGLLANDITAERPKIKGADAIHLASACFVGVDVLVTRNFRDFKPDDVYRGVLMRMPFEFGGEGLFAASDVGRRGGSG